MLRNERRNQTSISLLILAAASAGFAVAYASPPVPAPSSQTEPAATQNAKEMPVLRPAKNTGSSRKDTVYDLGSVTVTGSSLQIMCSLRRALTSHFSFTTDDPNQLICYPAAANGSVHLRRKSGLYCENEIAFMSSTVTGWNAATSAIPVWRPGAERFHINLPGNVLDAIKNDAHVKVVCDQYHSLTNNGDED